MDKNKENYHPGELDGLKGVCSRLAGDSLCRCGSNLKGRYCLWNYFSLPASLDISPPSDGHRKLDKILKQWQKGDSQ
jgi:hypothetical protein